jgi:hypothetical protein
LFHPFKKKLCMFCSSLVSSASPGIHDGLANYPSDLDSSKLLGVKTFQTVQHITCP